MITDVIHHLLPKFPKLGPISRIKRPVENRVTFF
jgi:hypothetical protein